MSKKYELTDESIDANGTKLFRIKALIDIKNVLAGELGGFVEKEENLNQYDNAWVFGDARVSGDARVFGDAHVFGDARVSGDALISEIKDILTISPVGSENGTLTSYQDKDKNILVTRGCFLGTLKEFKEAITKTHRDNEFAQEYSLAVKLIENRFKG